MMRVAVFLYAMVTASAKPVLTYFGIAGRGELARLYAAIGGVDIVDNTDTTGYKTKTPIGYLPALAHPEAGLFPNCTFAFACRKVWQLSDIFAPFRPSIRNSRSSRRRSTTCLR